MQSPNTLRRLVTTIGPFAIAVTLLYLAFRGTDTTEFWNVFSEANYFWLIPLVLVTLLSHLLRAIRWTIFMAAVPSAAGRRLSKNTAFGALIVGYMVNYATPRLGEMVRAVIVSRREKLELSSVVGTVVVDRAIDVMSLGVALLSVVFFLRHDTSLLTESILNPAVARLSELSIYVWILIGVLILLATLLLVHILRSKSDGLRQLVIGFIEGLLSVVHSRRPLAIIGLTLAMWTCYISMALVPFYILQYSGTYPVSILVAWNVMIIGSLGIVVPSPGGIGSYHYITILALTGLYGLTQADAAAYAFLSHGAQLVLYTLVGFAYVLFFGMGFSFASNKPAGNEPSVMKNNV